MRELDRTLVGYNRRPCIQPIAPALSSRQGQAGAPCIAGLSSLSRLKCPMASRISGLQRISNRSHDHDTLSRNIKVVARANPARGHVDNQLGDLSRCRVISRKSSKQPRCNAIEPECLSPTKRLGIGQMRHFDAPHCLAAMGNASGVYLSERETCEERTRHGTHTTGSMGKGRCLRSACAKHRGR
jgi:hypothetical protein